MKLGKAYFPRAIGNIIKTKQDIIIKNKKVSSINSEVNTQKLEVYDIYGQYRRQKKKLDQKYLKNYTKNLRNNFNIRESLISE